MKKIKNNLSNVILYVLIILIVLLAVTNYLASGLYARYSSNNSAFDESRVAVWDVSFNDSYNLDSNITSTHLDYGSSGEWGLDIINSSEVSAALSDSSRVRLRLYSPKFDANHHHDTWDFLENGEHEIIDNPINFKVYLYNCNYETLTNYYLHDGVFDNSIQQPGLNVLEHLVFDTSISPLVFEMIIEDGIFYYETTVHFSDLDEIYNLDPNTGVCCLRLVWGVDVVSGAVITDDFFNSYHLVKKSEYDNSVYQGIVDKNLLDVIDLHADGISDLQINNYLNNNIINVESTDYVIAYKEHDYFEYLIYTSSLGGEVMITFDSLDGRYIRRCTKMSNDELTILNNRSLSGVDSVDSFMLFIEKLEYASYLEFIDVKSQYEQASGYVSLGLECKINFDLKVEQID